MDRDGADFQKLVDFLMAFAEKELRAHREFYPLAASIAARSGDLGAVATYDGNEHPSAQDVLTDLIGALTHEAHRGTIRASGIAYAVKITPPNGERSDAVAIDLEDREKNALAVFVPYHFAGDELHVSDSFQRSGKIRIFR